MQLSEIYQWEIETADGTVRQQYLDYGTECRWQDIPAGDIIRASIVNRVTAQRHDCMFNRDMGEQFVRRFGRGFIRMVSGGNQESVGVSEYAHCIVTTNYRLYVLSTTGQAIITHKDFELYL
jgi:hypothetical protein